MALDIEKMVSYVAGLASHNASKEANLQVLAEELQQLGPLYSSYIFITEYIMQSYMQVFFRYILARPLLKLIIEKSLPLSHLVHTSSLFVFSLFYISEQPYFEINISLPDTWRTFVVIASKLR